MYKCSKCGAAMSQPLDRCPKCGVLLSGIKCEACGYLGGKSEFIINNHRCPKCNSITYVPGRASPSTSTPFVLSKRLIMMIVAGVISAIITLVLSGRLVISWNLINAALVGLVIYEIMYRTRKWLSPKTLIIYVIAATPISSWLYALLVGIETQQLGYALSLGPLRYLFAPANFPSNLIFFIHTALVTGIAYWLIRKYRIDATL